MPVYQVGIDISKAKSTTIIVRLNAKDKAEANKKAYKEVEKIHWKERDNFLRKFRNNLDWDDEPGFQVEGNSFEEFPINYYDADIDISTEEDPIDNSDVPENQLKLFEKG